MEIGKNIYSSLKKNNTAVISISIVAIALVICSLVMVFFIYKESQKNMFAINDKGALVPLVKLNEKEDKIKQVKANCDYFVSLYYDLDGYTMKEKKEKVYWLLGTQPTTVMKDRDNKGYFNNFLSISGLIQHAYINQKSWKISGLDAPYNVQFTVNISIINGNTIDYYTENVNATLEETNRNYPYNPYGFLITKFSDELIKVVKEDKYKEEKEQTELNNQND